MSREWVYSLCIKEEVYIAFKIIKIEGNGYCCTALLGTFIIGQISKFYNFLDFTHRRVDQVNRRGLAVVKDEFYLFIRSIENSVHKTLNISLIWKYEGEDIRDVLRNKILQNYLVQKYWHLLAHCLPSEQLADTLTLQIVEKWIDIRARSFVKERCYMQFLWRKIASSKTRTYQQGLSQL